MGRLRTSTMLVSVFLTGAMLVPAARADMVVIRSSGGAPEAGRVLATGASVTLPAGAAVTLLAQNGHTVTLAGPYSGIPDGGGGGSDSPPVLAAVSRLLTSAAPDSATLGVTRTGGGHDPYAIGRRGGVHCQAADRAPALARDAAGGEVRVRITSAAGNESTTIFAEGAVSAPWPADLLFDDASYALRFDGQPTPVKLTVRRAPAGIRGVAALAAWMGEHGCAAQARAILSALP